MSEPARWKRGAKVRMTRSGRRLNSRIGMPTTGVFLGLDRTGHLLRIRRDNRKTTERYAPEFWELAR